MVAVIPRLPRCLAVLVALAYAGCDGTADRVPRFDVDRVEPQPGPEGIRHIALNQAIKVWFTADLDPATVSGESVRVVDADGYAVPGRIEVGTRSIRFEPLPPLSPELDDGAFRPGERYWLELVGLPTSFALGAIDGTPLARGRGIAFDAIDEPAVLGLPTPFLPVDLDAAPLELAPASRAAPRMAVGERTLTLQFTRPVLPTSLRPAAFEFVRDPGRGGGLERVPVESVRAIGDFEVDGEHFGSTLRVQLARSSPLDAASDLLYFGLADGPAALRDYLGRPVAPIEAVRVQLEPGDQVQLARLPPRDLELRRDPRAAVGFEVRDGRVYPRVRVEAGSGVDDTRIATDGLAFDAASGAAPQFTEFRVPSGATVRLRAVDAALVIRAVGDIVVAGELLLETVGRPVPWSAGSSVDCATLLREAPIALVAGGDIRIDGRVRLDGEPGGAPLFLLAGGDVHLAGPVPAGTVIGVADGQRVHGEAESVHLLQVRMTPGLPEGVTLVARAWTRWITLPPALAPAVRVRLDDVDGAIGGWLRAVPPSSQAPDGRPLVDERRILETPLDRRADPLPAWEGMILQVGFEAQVVGGRALPSLGGFTVAER